jgi:hypothetical protein
MGAFRLIWKFFNSAFALWLLSSVVIASFLSVASQEERCSSIAISAVPKLAKSASERDLRLVSILTALRNSKSDPEAEATINDIITGSKYFYQDYKGKSMLDLEFIIVENALQTYNLGFERTPDPEVFSLGKKFIPEILELSSSNPADRQLGIRQLREQLSDMLTKADSLEKILSHQDTLTEFPFVLKSTSRGMDAMFSHSPCQPLFLIRNRIKQYLGGLGS